MTSSQSTSGVLLTLLANLAIAVAKLVAAAWTNSSAMLSEAVHTLVGLFTQALQYVGLRKSERLALVAGTAHSSVPATESTFWGFVVGVLFYAMGAGVAIYDGVHKFLDPRPLTDAHINYVVLAVAMCLVAFTTLRAIGESGVRPPGVGVLEGLKLSKNAALFTVVLKNIAAMAGLVIALAGVMASHLAGVLWADGLASVTIGLVMALVAIFMAIELRSVVSDEAFGADVALSSPVRNPSNTADIDRVLAEGEDADLPHGNDSGPGSGNHSGNDRGKKAKKSRRR